MEQKENNNFGLSPYTKSIETLFWFVTIASAIFINLSHQAFQGPKRLSYLFIFLSAVVIILLIRGIRLIKTNSRKIINGYRRFISP